jgi:hypothetical protein
MNPKWYLGYFLDPQHWPEWMPNAMPHWLPSAMVRTPPRNPAAVMARAVVEAVIPSVR